MVSNFYQLEVGHWKADFREQKPSELADGDERTVFQVQRKKKKKKMHKQGCANTWNVSKCKKLLPNQFLEIHK